MTETNKGKIIDSKSFLFTLNSNGRIDGKKQYYSKYGEVVFTLCDEKDERLMAFGEGHDICIFKEEIKNKSYCKHKSFNYRYTESLINIDNSNTFIPKKFCVIQMLK